MPILSRLELGTILDLRERGEIQPLSNRCSLKTKNINYTTSYSDNYTMPADHGGGIFVVSMTYSWNEERIIEITLAN